MSSTLALVMAVTAVPITASAGTSLPLPLLVKKKKKKRKRKDGVTPEQAADRRMPIQDQGRQMVEAGELTAATILFDGAAETNGDPVLFLDAGDAYLATADADRDIAAAETAKLRAQTAQDILYFHLDDASDPDVRMVTDAEITGLLSRANLMLDQADTLIDEIEAEQEALSTPAAAPAKAPGDGKGMRIAGLGLVGLGLAGVGVGAAGLVIGRVNQSRVDDPTVYGAEFDGYDLKGRRGNVLAGVGFAVGGVALAAGVTLFIIGRNRGKKAGTAPTEPVALVPTGRGMALVGRF